MIIFTVLLLSALKGYRAEDVITPSRNVIFAVKALYSLLADLGIVRPAGHNRPSDYVVRLLIAVFKDYSLNRHYESKPEEKHKNSTDAEWARPSEDLLAKLQRQQGFLQSSTHPGRQQSGPA
ncbi:hypothetical protein MHYP_G00362640 [Metynnis hypsauchen]